MLRLPAIEGIIRRRLLVNFRCEPKAILPQLPQGLQPKLHNGFAVAGICLIRLEQIRPKGLPRQFGTSSENAAHRIAVLREDGKDGVFIPRRDTNSCLNTLAGGRLFPGEHHVANFIVEDDGYRVSLTARSHDESMGLRVRGHATESLPADSCFSTLQEASSFFETGCVGYSPTPDALRFDGIELCTKSWSVDPFEVDEVRSSFFEDRNLFPPGSAEFDHCLIMRDIPHAWRSVEDFRVSQAAG